jgi:hypothetical protein
MTEQDVNLEVRAINVAPETEPRVESIHTDSKVFLLLAPLTFGTLMAFAVSAWIALVFFASLLLASNAYCADKRNATTPFERWMMCVPVIVIWLCFDRTGHPLNVWGFLGLLSLTASRWRPNALKDRSN